MLDRRELLQTVRQLIVTVTGIDEDLVFIGNPNEDVAQLAVDDNCNPLTYITVTTGPIQQFGQATIVNRQSSQIVVDPQLGNINLLEQSTTTHFNLTFNMNFFRGDLAYNYASAFDQANKRPPVSSFLRANDLGWRRVAPTNNLTALQNSNFESRYQRDLFLYVDNTVTDIINPVYRVETEVQEEDSSILDSGEVILE